MQELPRSVSKTVSGLLGRQGSIPEALGTCRETSARRAPSRFRLLIKTQPVATLLAEKVTVARQSEVRVAVAHDFLFQDAKNIPIWRVLL